MSDVDPDVQPPEPPVVDAPAPDAPPAPDETPVEDAPAEESAPDTIADRVNEAAQVNTVEVPAGSGVDNDAPVPVGTGMATSTLGAQSVVQQVANGEVEGEVAPAVEAAAEAVDPTNTDDDE